MGRYVGSFRRRGAASGGGVGTRGAPGGGARVVRVCRVVGGGTSGTDPGRTHVARRATRCGPDEITLPAAVAVSGAPVRARRGSRADVDARRAVGPRAGRGVPAGAGQRAGK